MKQCVFLPIHLFLRWKGSGSQRSLKNGSFCILISTSVVTTLITRTGPRVGGKSVRHPARSPIPAQEALLLPFRRPLFPILRNLASPTSSYPSQKKKTTNLAIQPSVDDHPVVVEPVAIPRPCPRVCSFDGFQLFLTLHRFRGQFVPLVRACLMLRPILVPGILIDHHYFYLNSDNCGYYSCGLARQVVIGFLRIHGEEIFLRPD